MAWLDSHSDANKIVDEDRSYTKTLVIMRYFGGTFRKTCTQEITDIEYRYVGMTYAAAVTCAAAMSGEAQIQRENDAGAYQVLVTEITEGDYAVETTTTTTTTTTTVP